MKFAIQLFLILALLALFIMTAPWILNKLYGSQEESCCDMVNCEYVAPYHEWVIYACERKLPGE